MKEKRYTLPEEQEPAFAAEPEPNYHGNAAMVLPEEDVAEWEDNNKDIDWERMPFTGGPANEEEAIARIEAIEADYEKTGISYSLEEVIAESHKRHPWLG